MKFLSKLKDFLKSKKFKELEEENIELKNKLANATKRKQDWQKEAFHLEGQVLELRNVKKEK